MCVCTENTRSHLLRIVEWKTKRKTPIHSHSPARLVRTLKNLEAEKLFALHQKFGIRLDISMYFRSISCMCVVSFVHSLQCNAVALAATVREHTHDARCVTLAGEKPLGKLLQMPQWNDLTIENASATYSCQLHLFGVTTQCNALDFQLLNTRFGE